MSHTSGDRTPQTGFVLSLGKALHNYGYSAHRLEEALAQVAVYRDQVLPAARRQIEAAEAGYTSGRNSFSDIMSAQRQLRRFEQAYAEALADTWRRRAALTRAAGTASGQPAEGGVR